MIKLGIIGAGAMARAHAEHFGKDPHCQVLAVCDPDRQRAQALAEHFAIPQFFTSLEQMLNQVELDAVTNVTPDAYHHDTSLLALQAGKHVFCEKPLALNASQAKNMLEAAQASGCINMLNLTYRNAAALQQAQQILHSGRLGRILHVEASYLQSWLSSQIWGDWRTESQWLWRLSSAHGSKGVLGDVGIHILDFASFPVGAISEVYCKLKCFSKAEGDRIGEYPLDANDSAVLQLGFANGALGSVHTSRWASGHANSLRLGIYAEQGAIRIDLDESWDELWLCEGQDLHQAQWQRLKCPPVPTLYQRFIQSIISGQQDQPDFSQGWRLQQVLDACFASDRQGQRLLLQEN